MESGIEHQSSSFLDDRLDVADSWEFVKSWRPKAYESVANNEGFSDICRKHIEEDGSFLEIKIDRSRNEPPSRDNAAQRSSKDDEELATKEDLQRMREQITAIIEDKIEEEMSSLRHTLNKSTADSSFSEGTVLDQYSKDVKKEFLTRVKEAGSNGLKKTEIMEIFNVKVSRANELQHQLAADLPYIEYEQSGSDPGLTRHKKSAYVEILSKYTDYSAEELKNQELKVLEKNYEKLKNNIQQGGKTKNIAFL
ncbi:hypothetical protein ACK3SF_03980 [Candidatus Nanosalina sp. VS9-1]|uniref:hypothetical protein n=1 Tax=Candidatus Nanosalina sp. VS9-1 TaxID=3388566 RepID=UPI0039DFFA3B